MKRIALTDDLIYRIAFVRRCVEQDATAPDTTDAKLDLADAVLAAVDAPIRRRLRRLDRVPLRPVQAVIELELRPKRRRA